MNFIVERSRIADVKNAGRFPTSQGVWDIPRQPNIGLPAERRRGAIGRDIGKVPLDPDIELMTGMTVVGKRRVRGEAHEQFAPAGGEIAMQRRDVDAGWAPLPFEGFSHNFFHIDEGLPGPKGQRVLVRSRFVGSDPRGPACQDQAEHDEGSHATCAAGDAVVSRVPPDTVHKSSFPAHASRAPVLATRANSPRG
jgi:hypothetical protein